MIMITPDPRTGPTPSGASPRHTRLPRSPSRMRSSTTARSKPPTPSFRDCVVSRGESRPQRPQRSVLQGNSRLRRRLLQLSSRQHAPYLLLLTSDGAPNGD